MREIKAGSGETLVETLAAAAVFLLMMGIMQGAVSFCTNAQRRSEALRAVNAEICEKLRTAQPDEEGPKDSVVYRFKAVSSDGGYESSVLFEVETRLGKKSVEYQDTAGAGQTAVFYLFLPAEPALPEGGGGGEEP